MTTLNPMTETTSPARLIQSFTVIAGSCVVNREKDKGRATLVLFLGDTTWGAERDLGARAVLLRLAISQPPISQTGDLPLRLSPHQRQPLPSCLREPGDGRARLASRGNAPSSTMQAQPLHLGQLQADDVLHRQTSNNANLAGADDAPPRAWSTGSCRNVRANNSRQNRTMVVDCMRRMKERSGVSLDRSSLFTRLAPVLNVRDVPAERAFYESLGLPVIYEGDEYPDFIAFGTETLHFGIQASSADNDPPSVLTWQIGVTDIDSAIERCRSAGVRFELELNNPAPGWTYRRLLIRTPGGYRLALEGPRE
jgi:catechol 2,3-dioxygenase-like lactoylglutathione lyase family enzyme